MSTQEMEQMDQEVMAVVNNHAKSAAEEAAEEILQEQREMNAGDSSAAVPSLNDASSTAQARSPFPRGEGLGRRINTEGVMEAPEAAARRKLHEEELAELEKKWRRKKNWRTVLCVALCMLIAAALLATLVKPELLILLVSLGVISCSVVAGIAVDRWIRGKDW